jgi:hypothetical protein
MRAQDMTVFGLDVRWRRRVSAAPPARLEVVGPWASVQEAPALARSMVNALGLPAAVIVAWVGAPQSASGACARLCFGELTVGTEGPLVQQMPSLEALQAAAQRRLAGVRLLAFRQALREAGMLQD